MIDKYTALQNTTDWIVNSSIEEFMSTFNELGDNYEGITLGEYIDLFLDTELDNGIEYNILTTDNFIFGAEVGFIANNSVFETYPIEEVSIKGVQHIKLDSNLTDCYNASNDELYGVSLAA